jgi:hypothetical protein
VGQILATGGTGTYMAAVAPEASATGGPVIAGVSGGVITISVGALPATGNFDINVSSGSALQTAIVHCT